MVLTNTIKKKVPVKIRIEGSRGRRQMLASAQPVDLNWFVQFVFTAFILVVGLLYLVKNTAAKYFFVDDNFEAAGGVGIGDSDVLIGLPEIDRRSRMPGIRGAAAQADACVVCDGSGSKQCSGCKAVRYCSCKCQRAHWHSGHNKTCKRHQGGKTSGSAVCSSTGIGLMRDAETSKTLKQSYQILFPYDEFIKVFDWGNPGFPPCGLLNCGNSCFANVVLQCLSHTRPLVAYLLEKGHKQECRLNNWCFLCEFQTHIERGRKSLHSFSPLNILSRLPNIGGNLGYGKQEDAHEFMRFAIDTMQAACLEEFGGEKAVHPSSQETTLLQHIFGGHLQSQVICTNCNKISNRYENMMDLTVEIQGDAATLEECLHQFTVKEWLHGDNMYKCDGCNDYVKAWKRLTVRQAPNILTIALKRFQSGRFGKLNKKVSFPETLDVSHYMTEAVNGTDIYKLYAVVVHMDMLNASYFGHYICYIKDFSGNWYMIDDCKVVKVELEDVLSEGAYMLLYTRVYVRPSCLEPIEALRKAEQRMVTVAPEVSVDSHVPVSRLELSLETCSKSETEDIEVEYLPSRPIVSEETEEPAPAEDENRLLCSIVSESSSSSTSRETCLADESHLKAELASSACNNNCVREVVSNNLPECSLRTQNGNCDKVKTDDKSLLKGLQKCSGNEDVAVRIFSRNSSSGATLKPIFMPGFLGKCPMNKSVMRNGNSSQESGGKLSPDCEDQKHCNGFLNEKPDKIQGKAKFHLKNNGFSSSTFVQEQLEKCLNEVETVEISPGESVNTCRGDGNSSNVIISTDIITSDIKEKNKFCTQNNFNNSPIQQKC